MRQKVAMFPFSLFQLLVLLYAMPLSIFLSAKWLSQSYYSNIRKIFIACTSALACKAFFSAATSGPSCSSYRRPGCWHLAPGCLNLRFSPCLSSTKSPSAQIDTSKTIREAKKETRDTEYLFFYKTRRP